MKRKQSGGSDIDDVLVAAIHGMGEHREESAHINKKRLKIEEEKFALEQKQVEESARRDEVRLEMEREKNQREAEESKQHKIFEMLKKYHELKSSDDALDKLLARKYAAEIAKAEDLDGFE